MAISLKSMRYFNAVVAHGSIAKAAAELNIAASAVSAALDHVEEAFDLTLLTRQRARGIEATAAGREIAQKFARLLEDYQAILAEGAELKQSLSGQLRVGYYAPVAPAFLPALCADFLPPGSDVTLHLTECDNDAAQNGLLRGDFDVILFVAEGAQASVEFDVLLKAPAYCLLPADHRLARQASVRMAQIAREPLVTLNRPVAAAYYHRLFEDFVPGITVAAYANSTEMVRSLVGAGHGCAVLNMRPLTAESYGGDGLVARPIADPLPPLTLAVAYARSRPRRIVQRFVAACREHLERAAPDLCVVDPEPPKEGR